MPLHPILLLPFFILLTSCLSKNEVLVFQNGREIKTINGFQQIYTKSTDTSITTQYISSWNNNNGITYYLGSGPTRYIAEESTQFRTLLKFSSLHYYIPSSATILESDLTLSFVNWNSDAVLHVCFITKPWNDVDSNRYKDTGWRFNRWNSATSKSESWTQPGAWDDCDPRVNMVVNVPGNGAYGNVTRTITLDPSLVGEWLQNTGATNFGVLMKAVTGKVSLLSSGGNAMQYTPSLRVVYTIDPNATPPNPSYPINYPAVHRNIFVSPNGSDLTGTGLEVYPYASPRKALFEAFPGDHVLLMTGVYAGGLTIDKPGITLESAPNHFGTIASPLNDHIASNNVITIRAPARGGVIRNLEITGGYYYGLMFFSDWENFGSIVDRVNKADAPRDYVLENLHIHHTGSSCVKMTMKVSNVKLLSNEIHHCGHRYRNYGHGIEGVQSHFITVHDSYIHHVAGAGIHLVGGSMFGNIQRNFFYRTNFGMNIGFATEYEYLDPIHNPSLFENLHSIIANNIFTQSYQAGINLWAAKNITVIFNTLYNVQHIAQNALLLNSYQHVDAPNSPIRSCEEINIIANIFMKSKLARVGPIMQIRDHGFNPSSVLNMAGNVYYDEKSSASEVFRWGVGVMIEDEGIGSFVGNVSAWSNYCTIHLQQSFCDLGSIEGNPLLSSSFDPSPCSPALNRASWSQIPNNIPRILDDFHGRTRDSQSLDAGAVMHSPSDHVKSFPPIPSAFANLRSYSGPGKPVDYYNQYTWPYQYWLTRKCRDLYVNSVTGNDYQSFNYDSSYTQPFKTISVALTHINQCDRILLEGGQTHLGPFGIYRPNVTIMTNPAHSELAIVHCHNIGNKNCIMTGEGFYDGAAALKLLNFKIIMTGTTNSGDCIRLNEGYGGGYSPYWKFYVDTSRTSSPRGTSNTIISNIEMTGCSSHGIKLSTFITNVIMKNIKIFNIKLTAIEIRNGNNLLIKNCYFENITNGIVMGGGSKNNLIENNLIRNYQERGIILGSDYTEVQYMDIDYVEKSIHGSWHDAINCTVRNNIISNGQGAGISFYSARNITVIHNTFVNVAMSSQAAILFNLSPKLIDYGVQLYPQNEQIIFSNNIVQSGGPLLLPMIESRVMQASVRTIDWPSMFPNISSDCDDRRLSKTRQYLRKRTKDKKTTKSSTLPFTLPTGTQTRNSDGSCPQFPDDNLWHVDVSSFPVHPNSESIKMLISSGGRMHHDFGGGVNRNGKFIPYGIPFVTVNTNGNSPQPLVPISIAPTGYPDECDYPLLYPFPSNAPVEGAYFGCPDATCPGDRHVLVLDNSTCTLYETWRSFPPAVTGAGWVADIAVKWNLLSNDLRPLGYTSSDAAGLPVLPGLVQFEEVIIHKEIKHALRFTGPNSRAAYSLPATHFAPSGNTGSDSPWMGMRIRLKSSFDCSTFAPASRVFCIALQKYGGIFADNGSPWYFTGEGTAAWNPYLRELSDIGNIAASDIEVLDSGCLCLSADCTLSDCGNGVHDGLPVYPAIENYTTIHFSNNIYWNSHGAGGRFTDRRAGYLGDGYDGDLNGWNLYTHSDATNLEMNPEIDQHTYRLQSTSPLKSFSEVPDFPMTDFFGREISSSTGKIEVGVIFGTDSEDTASPTFSPSSATPSLTPSSSTPPPSSLKPTESRSPSRSPTLQPTKQPTYFPSKTPTPSPTAIPTRGPSRPSSVEPTRRPTLFPTRSPTKQPTQTPTRFPTRNPTVAQTRSPSKIPTAFPTRTATKEPSKVPTRLPTLFPTRVLTTSPTTSSIGLRVPARIPTALPRKQKQP